MSKHKVIDLEKPEQIIEDHVSELLKVKARAILREALELEEDVKRQTMPLWECNLSMELLNTRSSPEQPSPELDYNSIRIEKYVQIFNSFQSLFKTRY